MSDGRAVARAIDALRRGWPVTIDGVPFLAVEPTDDAGLAAFDDARPADLLISANRAATLKLANQRDAASAGPVRIARAKGIDLAIATALADPALDLATPLKGPFQAVPVGHEPEALAALRLARLAGLFPALFVNGSPEDVGAAVSAQAIRDFRKTARLIIAARAHLPTAHAERAEIVAFRAQGDAAEHIALLMGSPNGRPPLVRIHSECLTGDVFASLKCDCGPQLTDALAAMAVSGWGILLYLRQEGRGIGLVNKLRAYALQDQGFDTIDANLRLGFDEDERDYDVAARMLALLSQDEVRLLTNNPRKVSALEDAGIRVAERVSLKIAANPHNAAYLEAKRLRSGHLL